MRPTPVSVAVRTLLLAGGTFAGLVGAAVGLTWAASASLAAVRAPGPARFDDLLAVSAAAGAGLCLAWLAMGVLLTVAASVPTLASGTVASLATHLTPPPIRRCVAGLIGATVLGISAGAAPGVLPTSPAPAAGAGRTPTPGPHPPAPAGFDRPALAFQEPYAAEPELPPELVVVHRGDTLWDLAAAALPPPASEAGIARAWPRWHAVNRAVIGTDPHLLHPGQVLHAPPAHPAEEIP